MRTLFVLNRADDEAGGSLTAALNLGEALSSAGCQVVLTAPVSRYLAAGDSATSSASVAFQPFNASRFGARFGFSLAQIRWLWKSVRSFDVVHLHSTFYAAAAYAALICRLRRVPYFVWPHGSLDSYDVRKHATLKRFIGPIVIRPVLAGSFAILCTSGREVQQLTTYGAAIRGEVIPLPVARIPPLTAEERDRWRVSHSLSPDTVVIVSLGRITAKKQLPLLVEAFGMLGDLDTVLLIAGEPDNDGLRGEISRTVDRLGVSSRVRMMGWVSQQERSKLFASAEIFALPSQNENFGLAVVEAMSAGLAPVISPDVYLAADFADADAALITPAQVDAFASALRSLCENPERRHRIGRNAQKLSWDRYTPAKVAELLSTLQASAANHSYR